MGFMPDYEEGGDGVRIAEVRPGGAADKCGLRSGDVITKFAGLPVRDVHDYMAALGTVKVGDKIQIELKRGAEPMKIDAEVGVSNR
jgi:S1-C subfamily serine protease